MNVASPPTGPVAPADRPAPAKPSQKVVGINRAGQAPGREGKTAESRKEAAKGALEKLHNETIGPTSAKAAAEQALGPEVDPNDIDASNPAVNPLAAEVLGDAVKDPAAEAREARRKASADRIAKFERDRQARAAAHREVQERDRAKAELDAREAMLRSQVSDLQLAKEKPFDYLTKIGLPPQELVKRAVNDQDPQAQLQKQLEEIRTWKSEQEKQIQAWREEQEKQARYAKIEAFENVFTDTVKSNPADYPTLRRYSPNYVRQECRIVSQQILQETKQWPGDYPGAPCTQKEILHYVQDKIMQEESAAGVEPAAKPSAGKAPPREGLKPAATLSSSLNGTSRPHARRLSKDERKSRARELLRRAR